MSQFDFGTIDASTKSGSQLALDLNDWRDALNSSHKGSSAPSYILAGMTWVNDSVDPWVLNLYDGTDSIALGTFNTTTNVFTVSGIGSIVQAYSADIPTVLASQAEMEAGTETAIRSISPLRVKQAIEALQSPTFRSTPVALSGLVEVIQTSIPEWVQEVLVIVNGASGSTTATISVSVGSDTVMTTTSGYTSILTTLSTGVVTTAYTSGAHIGGTAISAATYVTGVTSIQKIDEGVSSTNCMLRSSGGNGTSYTYIGEATGSTSSGKLSRVRLSINAGTFDDGTVTFVWR